MYSSKSVKWRIIRPFFFILIFHCLAIFLFTRGFLLTRTELPYFSNCSDVSQSPCFSSFSADKSSTALNQTGWTKRVVDRVVIIVLDALRFDFVAPSTFFEEKKPWMDKLSVLQKLAAESGSSARIFKAIADPPTTSLQRLKGLTTGGLPTFVDVGNSFGAPAIVEDNLIQQLVQNGKRVVMMGDDTWMQLFPHHFEKSYPYPSFNVKDLDTVDNGCIEHLLPSLYEEDWDVLIAHFLGVDHAGHIFGVNTVPMIQKLEQYNSILEKVIEALKAQSGPDGLHENTFLLVLGDHGQTLSGDHGGGSPEEVETSIFAMKANQLSYEVPPELDISTCKLNMDEKQICISTIEQLDFAATISAMLGVPFPFGSIGRVNPHLYALGTGAIGMDAIGSQPRPEKWLEQYANVLCINAWQVKRYIDVYSASSVIGLPSEDLLHSADIYTQAQKNWSRAMKGSWSCKDAECDLSETQLKGLVDAYLDFLGSVIELARSKWTEFDIKLMVAGFSMIFLSLLIQLVAMRRVNKSFGVSSHSTGYAQLSAVSLFAIFLVIVRACSFLSNSFILEEGKVVIFFLSTTAILQLRYSLLKKMMLLEALVLLSVIGFLRFAIEFGSSKQASGSVHFSWMLGVTHDHPVWIIICLVAPSLALLVLAYMLHKYVAERPRLGIPRCNVYGTALCYILIGAHWFLESELLNTPHHLQNIGRIHIPRLIFAVGLIQLMLLSLGKLLNGGNDRKDVSVKVVAALSACSSTIIILSGKQSPFIALAGMVGAWSIMRLGNLRQVGEEGTLSYWSFYGLPVTQWSLLALCLFFCSGHWCAFDGLRYGAAFIGFDEFILIRQAILLSIDTFGFSHILPIFGLPFLVSHKARNDQSKRSNSVFVQLSQVYLMYGFIATTAVLMTVLCVSIHRRHLMVWGLFAPKYVFEAVGLIITDVLICFAVLYYIDPVENDTRQKTAREAFPSQMG